MLRANMYETLEDESKLITNRSQ